MQSPRTDSIHRRTPKTWSKGDYVVTTDPARIDLDVVHGFLSQDSYWAAGRSRADQVLANEMSRCFTAVHEPSGAVVGFARVLTDYIVLAFLADVFVVEAHRDKGLGRWLVDVVTNLPELRSVRRWLLGTRDAHDLYRQFGFGDPKPNVLMERVDPNSDRPATVFAN
jgi:GNAT superfamily N-acetyltransferase